MGVQIVKSHCSQIFQHLRRRKKNSSLRLFHIRDTGCTDRFQSEQQFKRIQNEGTSCIKHARENIIHNIWICKRNISSKPFTQNWLFLFVVKPFLRSWPFLTISHIFFVELHFKKVWAIFFRLRKENLFLSHFFKDLGSRSSKIDVTQNVIF
jgi:hypothetical protein